jgi:hypothetical protein
MSVEIYGLVYHSPLIIRTLVPYLEYNPIYLEAKWTQFEMQKYVKLNLDQSTKMPLILAGSITILQQYIKAFPDRVCKVILFDCPNMLNPYLHPLLEWLDCDHQSGGAWQIAKIKYELFEEMLRLLQPISEEGKNLISSIVRFIPREKNEIERVEKIPANYKELVDSDEEGSYKDETVVKDSTWKKKTLMTLLKELFIGVSKTKRQMMLDIVFNYFFKNIIKKEYQTKILKLTDGNENLKKKVVVIRKWIDDGNLGGVLFSAFLDFITNCEKRCWQTILEENENVSDEDLLLVLGRQSPEDLYIRFANEITAISQRPANMFAPDQKYQWADESFHYHPETPDLAILFDL